MVRRKAEDSKLARYYHSDCALYRIEDTFRDHVVAEDCRTGLLIGLTVADLQRLTPLAHDRDRDRAAA